MLRSEAWKFPRSFRKVPMKAIAFVAVISALVMAPTIKNETAPTEAPPTLAQAIWAALTGGR